MLTMTSKADFDQKLRDVQEIEGQTGLVILSRYDRYNADELVAGVWAFGGAEVFRQQFPFTPRTTYHVDEHLWRGIVFRDPSR